ncbi:MAG TPA: alpha/beta hydrolase family protein [Mycobacteriales bacterium]|nr:alpha/beta hydrolase family protein [Mycobacteriales bacterium]
MRRRGGRITALLATALMIPVGWVVAGPAAAGHARHPELLLRNGHHIHVVAVHRYDDRDWGAVVRSPALGRAVDVRLLLPSGYADHPHRHYPVLYLFHGTSGRASDWLKMGQAEQATAGLPLIVVMPDAGFDGDGGGWFTNWYDAHTKLGPSRWETFHVHQLIPWVDANLRTVPDRAGRAIAGLSQGGFGSMSYAARHPDTFVSAASFSGAPDIAFNPVLAAGAAVVIEGTAVGLDGVTPDAMFGPRLTNDINWRGHDPTTLVTNLRGMSLWLWTAEGLPGPYDHGLPAGAMAIEQITHASTKFFYDRARRVGIPVHLDDYTFGTHTWAYWARDLRQYLPHLMALFAHPRPRPAVVGYRSVEPRWSQWGWTVVMHRAARQQFSALAGASRRGFRLTGNGSATVTTLPAYRSGSRYLVSVAGPGRLARHVITARNRRLRLHLPLGHGHAATATVRISPIG